MADAPIAVPPHVHDFTRFDYTDLSAVCRRCGARRDGWGRITEPIGIRVKDMDEQSIERAGLEVAKLDLADHILAWDKKQAPHIVEVTPGAISSDVFDTNQYRIVPNPEGRRCAIDPSHGMLQMHANGSQLLCCATRPTPCTYAEPVSR